MCIPCISHHITIVSETDWRMMPPHSLAYCPSRIKCTFFLDSTQWNKIVIRILLNKTIWNIKYLFLSWITLILLFFKHITVTYFILATSPSTFHLLGLPPWFFIFLRLWCTSLFSISVSTASTIFHITQCTNAKLVHLFLDYCLYICTYGLPPVFCCHLIWFRYQLKCHIKKNISIRLGFINTLFLFLWSFIYHQCYCL